MNSPNDVVKSFNMSYSIHDGVLDTTIPTGGVDAQFFLNKPQPIAPATFRYFSIRMYTDWKSPWQNVPDGMILRFIWGILGSGGHPTDRCWLVSQDIPFDIGWQTIWIDLGDPFNGKPKQSTPECPSPLPAWTNSPPILDYRIDPDENVTSDANITGGGPFHHLIDWIRLNAVNSSAAGAPYLVQLAVNRDLSNISYYYTTDRGNPTQAAARQFSQGIKTSGPYRIFLPLMLTPAVNGDMGGLPSPNVSFWWDTSGVAAGAYYICARATGGGNTVTYCSEVPVYVS
jgi:hypothetical protein